MSVFKTTFSRALPIYPTDNANIPFPTVITSSTNTAVVSFQLNDSSASFITDNIQAGDIVYNITTKQIATVVTVINEEEIQLNEDIFSSTDNLYIIYQASSQTGLSNQGCYLYVGLATDNNSTVTVTTIGGDVVTFFGVASGSILPVQVIKLHETDTENVNEIIALW